MKVLAIRTTEQRINFGFYDSEADALKFTGDINLLSERLNIVKFFQSPDGAIERIAESEHGHFHDHKHAFKFLLDYLLQEKHLASLKEIDRVAHFIAHGADTYRKPITLTKPDIKNIYAFRRFSAENEPNVQGILLLQKLLKVEHVAVFDTGFHQSMERKIFLDAVPRPFSNLGIRKYGFHGLIHAATAQRVEELLKNRPHHLISCHLGDGCSVSAIKRGMLIDNTPCIAPAGTLTPFLSDTLSPEATLLYLRELQKNPKKFLPLIKEMKSVMTHSLQRLWHQAQDEGSHARYAIETITRQIVREIGAAAATLNGVDVLVFTGELQNVWYVRNRICEQLSYLGVSVDWGLSQQNHEIINTPHSRVKVLSLATELELQLGREGSQKT